MNKKTILKYGCIFTTIYGALLLIVTLYSGMFLPADVGFIVPLWLLAKPLMMELAGLPSWAFLLIMITIQAIAAFIQGIVIGMIVSKLAIHREKDGF